MPLLLTEAAKLSQDDLQRGVLETFVQESSVLDRIPFLTIQGNAYAYNEEATLPGVQFRSVNEAYSESTGTVNPKSEKLVIMGGDADVDRFIVQTRGNLNDQRALQTRLKVKAASYFFQDKFINGDTAVDTKGFDGLKKRLTGSQVLAAGANGMGPVAGGHDFFDALDALIAQVPGISGGNGALYTNAKVIAKIKSSARRLGGVEMIREALTQKMVATYNGIPLLDIGQTSAGADIIPQTETQGTATGTTASIYAVKFGGSEGDQAVTGLTNGGVQVRDLGELDTMPVFRTRLEFYTGLAIFGGKGAARLTGVLNA
ncbi:major capsid protein [Streptomyces narbonensis]|uniref:major capsid protein n=1 Tax=Streptomyces narbonensis TaxID=67333 RepID=UPI0033E6899A